MVKVDESHSYKARVGTVVITVESHPQVPRVFRIVRVDRARVGGPHGVPMPSSIVFQSIGEMEAVLTLMKRFFLEIPEAV